MLRVVEAVKSVFPALSSFGVSESSDVVPSPVLKFPALKVKPRLPRP